MERHGSESYFVLGEGLLGEARGGRRLASVSAFASVPPFRFSRLGPKGTGKQLGKPNRVKIARDARVTIGTSTRTSGGSHGRKAKGG